jgi:hypothetical protein
MIDLATHRVVRLGGVPQHLAERCGIKRLHRSTAHRWRARGLRAPDGTRVRLETIRVGGTYYTSLEALQTFFERLAGSGAHPGAGPPGARRRRAEEHAGEKGCDLAPNVASRSAPAALARAMQRKPE